MGLRVGPRSGVVMVALAFMAGCSSESPTGGAATITVTDSSGVRIVQNNRDAEVEYATVDPVWQHGHDLDDYAFQFVILGTLRDDGSSVLGDMGNQEVVAISSGGENYTVLARTGQGPGEVIRPRAVVHAGGGRVWVEDSGNRKLLLFDGDSLVSIVSGQANPEVSFGLMPQGVDREGHLLMTTASYQPDFEEPWLLGSMVRFDPGTGAVDTVGHYPFVRRPSGGAWNPYPSGGWVASAGGGFINAISDQPQVIWRTAEGKITQIGRWEPTLAYPTDSLRARFEASLRADMRRVNPQLSGKQLDDFVNQQVARYEVDPSVPLPLFGSINGTSEGDVWMAEFSPGNTLPTTYRVMSATGEWLGSVEFPGPFRVLQITGDLVLGMLTDELDVQAVALFRYRFD